MKTDQNKLAMHVTYPAKLLLFGEYAVLCNGEGLAIPQPGFFMNWKKKADPAFTLFPFFEYLLNHEELPLLLDLKSFKSDLENDFSLTSNIPTGYGLGSSGAVVAAVYDRYALNKRNINIQPELSALRTELSEMENFFHAKSSGLDPMVSFIQRPVIFNGNGEIIIKQTEPFIKNYFNIALFDTQLRRITSVVVNQFNDHMKEPPFQKIIENDYLKLVADCISTSYKDERQQILDSVISLSQFQLKYFSFAIPKHIISKWENGLSTGKEIYKLCGAGGGGFMIVFSPND